MTPIPSPFPHQTAPVLLGKGRKERKKESLPTSILEETTGRRGSKREKERGNGEQVENEIWRTREERGRGGGWEEAERRESPDKKIQSSTSL